MRKIFLLSVCSLSLASCASFSPDSHSTGWGSKSSEVFTSFNSTIIDNGSIPTEGKTKKTISFVNDSFVGKTPANEEDILMYVSSGADLLDDIYFYNNMNLSLAPVQNIVPGGLQLGKLTGQSGIFSFKLKETVTNLSINCRVGFLENPFSLEQAKVGIYNNGVVSIDATATKIDEVKYMDCNFNFASTDSFTLYSIDGRVIINSISYWK